MLILAVAFFADSLLISVEGVECLYHEISCPCGKKTDSIFTICTEQPESVQNLCGRFQSCESCRSGLNQCLTCPEGFSGPYCSEGNGSTSRHFPFLKEMAKNGKTLRRQEREQPETYCGEPGVDPNGKRIAFPWKGMKRHSKSKAIQFSQGMQMEYSCRAGYFLQGEDYIQCLETGRWSAPAPTCQLIPDTDSFVYCKDPGFIAHGRRVVLSQQMARGGPESFNQDSPEFPEGTKLKFSCNEGLKLEGDDVLTCQNTGYWTKKLPYCTEAQCGRSLVLQRHRISGGMRTLPGEWPWIVAIASRGAGVFCGAALISPWSALTAAHCIYPGRIQHTLLYFGKYHVSMLKDDKEVISRRPTSFIVHPNYNELTLDNDIAIIRFAPKINYTERIQPICLPTFETTATNLVDGKTGWMAGWGITEKYARPDTLLMASVPVVPKEECLQTYREKGNEMEITSNMFCAGFKLGLIDSCLGDSGGPLVFLKMGNDVHYVLEGIVSFGGPLGICGQPKKYTVYTKVGNYLKWIRSKA